MTKPGVNPSSFNANADSAAQALRGNLIAQGRQMPKAAPVEVGPDGKPPAPPPPEGSYARMAMEQRQAEHARQIGDQPVAGTPNQALDGSQAPPLAPVGQPPLQTEPQDSPRAQRRIQELVDQLRARDAELAAAREEGKRHGDTLAQTQQRMAQLEQQHQQMLQANLDNLDPETRMRVMQDARMREYFDQFEERILSKVQPQLQQIQTRDARREMESLSNKYPAFDLQIHGPLIDMFRAKNPACSIDQAYRAIAEPEELVTRQSANAVAVPPVLPPGSSTLASARFAPQPEPQSDPVAEAREESARMAKLRASNNPQEQKQGLAAVDDMLRRRVFGGR